MELNKSFDLLIKKAENNSEDNTVGYSLNGRLYDNYIDNFHWNIFLSEMKLKYSEAFATYGEGAGDELGLKKATRTPPKMASYGSSSRMIYLASRDIPNFKFEEKLPTTVGGTAHMDGYLSKDNTVVYIEAKCREPYSKNYYIIDKKYKHLYEHINDNPDVDIKCIIEDKDDEKMKVTFIANGIELTRFDIKQMISHLLGIATRHLKTQSDKTIRFIYFLYNPKNLEIADDKLKQKIYDVYDTEIKECESISFASLFKVILNYLQDKIDSNLDIVKCANEFSFKHCDQTTYLTEIESI